MADQDIQTNSGLDKNIVKHNPDLGGIIQSKASISSKKKLKSPSKAVIEDFRI